MSRDRISTQDLIALSLVPGAGRQTVHAAMRLARRADTPLSHLFGASLEELLRLAAPGEVGAARAIHGCGSNEQFLAKFQMEACAHYGIRHLTALDAGYPGFLRDALGEQTPPILFFQGNEALLQTPGVGVVGTRRPTQEGLDWALRAAQLFTEAGVPVISGGAAGVDLQAHQAALAADGETLVVLPEGLGALNLPRWLVHGLERGHVLLLSEFLPRTSWEAHRAMMRNRTIAAFSRLLCVVEPGAQGGSIHTAERALEYGRPVFYWGGACRNGALAGRHNAFPLTRGRGLDEEALLSALEGAVVNRPRQADLFETW